MRKCAGISGCGSDKLAMLGAKESLKKDKDREGEASISEVCSDPERCLLASSMH